MIASLLLSLLHLTALLLVVRLTLPERYAFMNPYAMAIDTLLRRLLGFLHTAIPLRTKPLCIVALITILATRTTISAVTGAPLLTLSAFTVLGYNVSHFLGWFGVELLRFIGFYLSVLACAFFLRCWHFGRMLPGYSGDLLQIATRPYSNLKLRTQGFGLLLLFTLYIALCISLAGVITYPMMQYDPMQVQLSVRNFFDFNAYAPLIRGFLLLGTTFFNTLAAIQNTIIILIFMLLLSVLFGNGPMTQFLFDIKRLLCGPIQTLRVGPIDFSLLAAYFILGLVYTLLITLLLVVATVLSYVV